MIDIATKITLSKIYLVTMITVALIKAKCYTFDSNCFGISGKVIKKINHKVAK